MRQIRSYQYTNCLHCGLESYYCNWHWGQHHSTDCWVSSHEIVSAQLVRLCIRASNIWTFIVFDLLTVLFVLTVLFFGGALSPILTFTVFDSFPNCYSSLFMADLARSTRNQPRRDYKSLHTGKSTLGKSDIVENHTALADEQGQGRQLYNQLHQNCGMSNHKIILQQPQCIHRQW